MNGDQLTFYTRPGQRHHDKPLAQRLADLATALEVCRVTMEFGMLGADA
jgi:hypothetical protein